MHSCIEHMEARRVLCIYLSLFERMSAASEITYVLSMYKGKLEHSTGI